VRFRSALLSLPLSSGLQLQLQLAFWAELACTWRSLGAYIPVKF